MTSKWLLVAPVAGALGVGAGVGVNELLAAGESKQDLKPATNLPITRVVLFNSGVGYFSRSGEVEGEARVDLTFPESDINDLLKSMVLEDFGKGRISAVSYDSSYSSWRRHQLYGFVCGYPSGESSHSSWRPSGVRSRKVHTLPSASTPRCVVK